MSGGAGGWLEAMEALPYARWASAGWNGGYEPPRQFFKDREPVHLCIVPGSGRIGVEADFTISARHARGLWTRWRTVETLRGVMAESVNQWSVEWKLADWEQLDRWAFADFRFDVVICDGARTVHLRSLVVRHYASCVGFYGFGPVGERWSTRTCAAWRRRSAAWRNRRA